MTEFTVTTLLIASNTLLIAVAAFFLRGFVADVRDLTKRVSLNEKHIAVIAAVTETELPA